LSPFSLSSPFHICKLLPFCWKGHVLRYVQVTCGEQNKSGRAAVEELQELSRRVSENASLEWDKHIKRLCQANLSLQYKKRQECSHTELTEAEKEALVASGGDHVLGGMDLGTNAALEDETATDAAAAAATPSALAPSWNEMDIPMATRPTRGSTKRPRCHLSESNQGEQQAGPKKPDQRGQAAQMDPPLFHGQRSTPVNTAQGMLARQLPLCTTFGHHSQGGG
jgi:hypothetical protein